MSIFFTYESWRQGLQSWCSGCYQSLRCLSFCSAIIGMMAYCLMMASLWLFPCGWGRQKAEEPGVKGPCQQVSPFIPATPVMMLGRLPRMSHGQSQALVLPGQSLAKGNEKTIPSSEEFVLWGWGRGMSTFINTFEFYCQQRKGLDMQSIQQVGPWLYQELTVYSVIFIFPKIQYQSSMQYPFIHFFLFSWYRKATNMQYSLYKNLRSFACCHSYCKIHQKYE